MLKVGRMKLKEVVTSAELSREEEAKKWADAVLEQDKYHNILEAKKKSNNNVYHTNNTFEGEKRVILIKSRR